MCDKLGLNRKGKLYLSSSFHSAFCSLMESSSSFFFPPVVRPEGKGSRPHVFSMVPNSSMRAGPLLDVAANSQEELKEWLFKIREVTVTSEAKVKTRHSD